MFIFVLLSYSYIPLIEISDCEIPELLCFIEMINLQVVQVYKKIHSPHCPRCDLHFREGYCERDFNSSDDA